MGDDPEEFADDEDREPPRLVTLGQRAEALEGERMLRELLSVGVDEDVRVDRDQWSSPSSS